MTCYQLFARILSITICAGKADMMEGVKDMEQASSKNDISLVVKHLQKSFLRGRKKILTDINLAASSGECIGILGANGCGKSTLLSILAGIQKADSGSCLINGRTFISAPKSKRHRPFQISQMDKQACPPNSLLRRNKKAAWDDIAYVPQECPLIEELNALDNLRLWYCNSPLSLGEELNNGFLAMLGITDFLKVAVKNMSGGMKKRLSIGCALAKDPDVLLLDEPGAALDLICKERIEVYLKHYKSKGNIILLTTHEEREIMLCDRVFILKGGTLSPLEYDGNIHQLASKI